MNFWSHHLIAIGFGHLTVQVDSGMKVIMWSESISRFENEKRGLKGGSRRRKNLTAITLKLINANDLSANSTEKKTTMTAIKTHELSEWNVQVTRVLVLGYVYNVTFTRQLSYPPQYNAFLCVCIWFMVSFSQEINKTQIVHQPAINDDRALMIAHIPNE